MPTRRASPYAVDLSAEARAALTTRLVDEIRAAKSARDLHMSDHGLIDFCYSLYEQQSQKGISRDTHRYGGADLTSPIGTENVDALSARAVQTIFKLEPLWMVEGIGASAPKAPAVEAFLQVRQEQMRFQKVAKRAITASLVETGSILEVCEDTDRVVRHAVVQAQIQQAEDGTTVLDPTTGQPTPLLDAEGAPVPAPEGSESYVEVKRTWTDYRRRGAYVRRRSMKDFAFLPSHAEDEREVWAHATRFYLRLSEIQQRATDGEYDRDAVEALGGDTQEREQRAEHDRAGVSVETVQGYDGAEKELWRVSCWIDVAGEGTCAVVADVSEIHACILKLEYDWLAKFPWFTFRTVYLNPYPCPYSVYGYTMVGTKLLTTIEEHTAWRNMNADRDTLEANAPMKVRRGTSWDPAVQAFGAGETIVLDNMDDVQPFEFTGSSVQALQKESQCVTDAQRLIGMNDIAIGQTSEKSRTLGENRMATTQSFVRTDDPISNLQEAFEEVARLIHAIEVQALRESEGRVAAPAAVVQQLSRAGDASFNGFFTADMLDGDFLFKPRGSSDQADPNRRQQVLTNMLGMMGQWAQTNPAIAARLASPEFADALMQMLVTEFRPRDVEAFLRPMAPPLPAPGAPMGAAGAPAAGPAGPPSFGSGVLSDLLASLPPGGGVQ